jgi:hypothetical protein
MKRKLWALAAGLLLAGQVSYGATTDEVIAEMKATIASLTQRLAELEKANRETASVAEQGRQAATVASQQVAEVKDKVAATGATSSWVDRISVKGDFRYRYQNDDNETSVDERNRQRIRARPVIVASLPGSVQVGLGLASGSDDPVSANQTLGGGGSSKDIKLDLAYFDWKATDAVHVVGGKADNRLYRPGDHGLMWDSDWRPEGMQLTFDNGQFFGTALGTWLESDSNLDPEFAWGLQAGVRQAVGGVNLMGGLGYYDIDAAGSACFFDPTDCFGNSVSPGTTYLYDFQIVEAFAEASFDVAGLPTALFVDYVNNGDADRFDTGYAAGVRFGKAKKTGSWELGYAYQDLEADAVLGLLTESDFAGGGTDSKGSVLRTAYALTDQTRVKLTYFMVERQDSNGVENGGVPFDLDTLQLDVEFKYE